MMNGITVIGLVSGSHIIEDIRVTVPYQVAVQISAEMAHRSRDLGQDIQNKKVLQIRGALPAGAVFRGGGAVPVPRPAAPFSGRKMPVTTETNLSELRELKAQIARLNQELAASQEKEASSKAREEQLQGLNIGLQTTLATMSGQLQSIQVILEDLKKQGVQISHIPGVSPNAFTRLDDDAPIFIPDTFKDTSKANIRVKETTTTSSGVSSARSALKNLRKEKKD